MVSSLLRHERNQLVVIRLVLNRNKIKEQIDVSRLAQSLKDGDKQDRVHQMLIEQQLSEGDLYAVLDDLDFENIEDAEDIGAYFEQVGEFYVK